jgi:hypothetical protein
MRDVGVSHIKWRLTEGDPKVNDFHVDEGEHYGSKAE